MSIYFCPKTRRQFLVGSGKALLTLPFLPSLITETALAQQMATPPKRTMLFLFEHCNLNEIWPQKSVATSAVGSLGIRDVNLSSLGPIASHSYAFANPRYEVLKNAGLMTYMRGFKQDGWNGCHGDMYLSAVGSSRNSADYQRPTADQVFENSQTLYPAGTPQSVRKAIRITLGGFNIFNHKVGNSIIRPPIYEGLQIQNFYNDVFGSLTGGTTPVNDLTNQFKSNILNRVMGSYSSFSSNRRISSEDRQRVTTHLDLLSDLQNNFATLSQNQQQITCSQPASPGNIGYSPVDYTRVYLSLLAVAFRCGLTKFGTLMFESHDPQWVPNLGVSDFHGAIHGGQGAAIQLRAFQNWWRYLSNSIADNFLAPLDQMEGTSGKTYLENMITGMIATGACHPNQAGNDGGHGGYDSQQILIGNMGGALRSGRYYNMNVQGSDYPYNSFLITLFHLMGIPPSEYAFATPDGRGFGLYTGYGANYRFSSRFYSPILEALT
jgi:hypothetical protein